MVASLLAPTLLLLPQSVAAVEKRYSDRIREMDRFEVQATISLPQSKPLNVRLVVDRKRPGLRYEAYSDKVRFFHAQDRGNIRQIDFVEKIYDDLRTDRLVIKGFNIAETMEQFMLPFAVYPTLAAQFPEGVKPTWQGVETVNGAKCDHLRARISGFKGVSFSEYWIDDKGLTRKVKISRSRASRSAWLSVYIPPRIEPRWLPSYPSLGPESPRSSSIHA